MQEELETLRLPEFALFKKIQLSERSEFWIFLMLLANTGSLSVSFLRNRAASSAAFPCGVRPLQPLVQPLHKLNIRLSSQIFLFI